MGCVCSKRFLRTTTFQENLKRPFSSVAAIPILDDMVLPNSHEFAALICKANKFAKKLPTPEPENVLCFISKDSEGERLISGNQIRVDSDLQSESSSKEEKSEKHETGEEESEEHKLTEKDKTETISPWEIMEALEDGEMYDVSRETGPDSDSLSSYTSDLPEELTDKTARERISRSKYLENFHTSEESDGFLVRRRRPFWNRNSKRRLYYLGLEHIETINEFSSISMLYSCPQLSLSERNLMPVVIEWAKEQEDDDACPFESAVLQASFDLSDTRNDVNSYKSQTLSENNNSEENNGIAHTVSENIGTAQTVSENEINNGIAPTISENGGSEENRHRVETTNIVNIDMAEENLEKDPSKETNSGKRRMHLRAKLNDLGGIFIPSTPDFSARLSLKVWLTGGGDPYSPGIPTRLLGHSESGDKWSKANDAGNSGRPSRDETKMETVYSPDLNIDDKLANEGESSVYSGSSFSGIENKQWEHSLFDPELLASFEKALEQLSEEVHHLLRQIDEDSNFC